MVITSSANQRLFPPWSDLTLPSTEPLQVLKDVATWPQMMTSFI